MFGAHWQPWPLRRETCSHFWICCTKTVNDYRTDQRDQHRLSRREHPMWLIRAAMRRPITVVVIAIAFALCSILAVTRMRADIFPDLNLPVIYVAQPYGGMSPQQMEGYLVYYYEYHFLYINGIESVESKSVQGAGL